MYRPIFHCYNPTYSFELQSQSHPASIEYTHTHTQSVLKGQQQNDPRIEHQRKGEIVLSTSLADCKLRRTILHWGGHGTVHKKHGGNNQGVGFNIEGDARSWQFVQRVRRNQGWQSRHRQHHGCMPPLDTFLQQLLQANAPTLADL